VGRDVNETTQPVTALALKLAALEERLFALAALIEDRRELDAEKVKLQAIEYERRLEELNHAHALAVQVQKDFVLRDVFDAEAVRTAVWRAKYEEGMNALRLEIQGKYVDRTVYEKSEQSFDVWRQGVDKDMNTQKGKDSSQKASLALLMGVLGLLTAIVGLILRFAARLP